MKQLSPCVHRWSTIGNTVDEETGEWDSRDETTCLRAIRRFDVKPRAMGIPNQIEPDPRKIEIEWPVNPVPIEVQKNVGKLVVKRGDFGFLSDEEV